jgi:hypothetical protein
MIIDHQNYLSFLENDLIITHDQDPICLYDHIGGFNSTLDNLFLKKIQNTANKSNQIINVLIGYVANDALKTHYPNLKLQCMVNMLYKINFQIFENYVIHPSLNYKNFICSFNGSAHVSRKLLVSALSKFNYYNPKYCSKNFAYLVDVLDGHIKDYVGDSTNFYRKFFISNDSEEFFQTVNSFGHVQYDHARNIYNLENKLTESFLHIVSETMATSYYPFVTEKFLYSVVTRGLFLAYAQPGWHAHLEKYYGFKRYTKLFDYRFDTIQNPVERLVELMSMISKFSVLSVHDWHDLYLIEQDTIEYNYNHYYSKDYLKCLEQYE